MNAISVFYALLFWLATLCLLLGVSYKVYVYAKVPAPLKIPVTPAPITRMGVFWRMFCEVVFFQSLFRANKYTWLLAFLFHWALWLIILRHLRYVVDMNSVLLFIQPWGRYASFAFILGLVGLEVRRLCVDRVRYISAPSDHLMLLLLIAIGLSGMAMSFAVPTNIVQVKAFFQGLLYFDWQTLPSDPLLLLHLFLVALLMIIFPISKLLHAPGVFFSPTRNQVDNPREHRYISES